MIDRGTLYTYSVGLLFQMSADTRRHSGFSLPRGPLSGLAYASAWHCTPLWLRSIAPELRFDGLMHDSPECITGRHSEPVKTDEIEEFEEYLLHQNYAAFK